MAVTIYTEDQLFDRAIGYFRVSFPTQDLSEDSFFGLLARAFARFFVLAQEEIYQADSDSVPAYQIDADGNPRSRCSTEALDAWAFVFGLPSGSPGIFGRRRATVSSGGLAIPGVSAAAVLLPANTQAADPTGQIIVKTVSATTLNGPPNSIPVQFVSVTTGVAANLPVGTVLSWQSPPAGLNATCTLTAALTGAKDTETNPDLVLRILQRIQNPPRGGTAADYRFWTEAAVDSNGATLAVARAYVYPLRSGLGTVDVVPLYGGSGTGRIPPAAEITKLQTAVDLLRPVSVKLNMLAAATPKMIQIRVRATPSEAKNGPDCVNWDDGGTAVTITAHTANTLTVAAVPAALSAAFAAGNKPRLQIPLVGGGGSELPFVVRVTNIVATVITIEESFPATVFDGTTYFWAGGGVVSAIAQRILNYVNALGPSRISGTADKSDVWEDQVLLERLVDIVMETKDTDGTKMVTAMPGYGSTAAQIKIGAAAFAIVPYRPLDTLVGAPELAVIRSGGIEVIR